LNYKENNIAPDSLYLISQTQNDPAENLFRLKIVQNDGDNIMNDIDLTGLEDSLRSLEEGLIENKRKLAELRRRLLKKQVSDYTFHAHDGSEVRLSELFGDRNELLLIHNMGKGCRYCTLWADGFNGIVQHLENRVPFVVVSPDQYEIQREFARGRGWRFRMFSSHGTSFFKDLGFENEKGNPMPGVSTFERSNDGKIFRISNTYFGPGDDFCSVWHLFDLLPKGSNDWAPKYEY
jgi:predicted dithiol-disulfide oxidoreductase (DUF899 family)